MQGIWKRLVPHFLLSTPNWNVVNQVCNRLEWEQRKLVPKNAFQSGNIALTSPNCWLQLLNIRMDFVLFPSEIEDPKMETSTKKKPIDIDHKSRWKFTCSGRSRCKPQPGQGPWCWGHSADPAKANLYHYMSRVNDVCLATKTSSYFASCTDLNLDAKENLLDGDGRAPVLLLVQDGEADLQHEIDARQPWARQGVKQKASINIGAYRATGVDIWVEERGHKLDLKWALSCKF